MHKGQDQVNIVEVYIQHMLKYLCKIIIVTCEKWRNMAACLLGIPSRILAIQH